MKKILGFGLALLLLLPATAVLAQVVAPVVVAATPATTEAVKEAAWWSATANLVITGLGTVLSAAVAALAIPAVGWLRQRSSLAALFVTQAMIDRMVLGIQNIIRAQATDLEHRLGTEQLSPAQKKDVAAIAQPKVEEAFKETLKKLGKTPGSAEVRDLILGHVEQALSKPVVVPAVMARS